MKYDTLTKMADNVLSYKNVAYSMKMIATFMPKPIFGDNASGMHIHQSLWKNSRNTFYDPDDEYAEISQTCRYYIGGLMEHSRTLCAITSPVYEKGKEAPKRIEFRPPDTSCNTYYAFAALAAAGLDGINLTSPVSRYAFNLF